MTIHVGLIGGGNISGTHARAAAAIPDVKISAVHGTNQEKVARLCHEFGGRVLAQLGSVDSVEVIKQRAIRLESAIQTPTSAPGQFTADSELLLQKQIGTEDRVSAAGERNRGMTSRGARGRGRGKSAYAESDVKLLRMKRAAYQKRRGQYH